MIVLAPRTVRFAQACRRLVGEEAQMQADKCPGQQETAGLAHRGLVSRVVCKSLSR